MAVASSSGEVSEAVGEGAGATPRRAVALGEWVEEEVWGSYPDLAIGREGVAMAVLAPVGDLGRGKLGVLRDDVWSFGEAAFSHSLVLEADGSGRLVVAGPGDGLMELGRRGEDGGFVFRAVERCEGLVTMPLVVMRGALAMLIYGCGEDQHVSRQDGGGYKRVAALSDETVVGAAGDTAGDVHVLVHPHGRDELWHSVWPGGSVRRTRRVRSMPSHKGFIAVAGGAVHVVYPLRDAGDPSGDRVVWVREAGGEVIERGLGSGSPEALTVDVEGKVVVIARTESERRVMVVGDGEPLSFPFAAGGRKATETIVRDAVVDEDNRLHVGFSAILGDARYARVQLPVGG